MSAKPWWPPRIAEYERAWPLINDLTAGNLVFSFVALLAPLASGVASRLWGLPVLFEASLGLSVLSLAWILIRVREPRDARQRTEPSQAHG